MCRHFLFFYCIQSNLFKVSFKKQIENGWLNIKMHFKKLDYNEENLDITTKTFENLPENAPFFFFLFFNSYY